MGAGTLFRPWLVAVLLIGLAPDAGHCQEHSYVPVGGFVPDAATAIAIAEAVLIPAYGLARMEAARPFSATLTGESWTVLGWLSPNQVGGVPTVVINKATGSIVRVTHGR